MTSSSLPRHQPQRVPHRRRWVVLLTAGIVLALLVGCSAWLGSRAWLAKVELEQSVAQADVIQRALLSGDSSKLGEASTRLSLHANKAAALTSDPIWRVAEIVPGIGGNFTAVRELAHVIQQVSTGVVAPLLPLVDELGTEAFSPVAGSIGLGPMVEVQPAVAAAAAAMAQAADAASAIDAKGAITAVRAAVAQLTTLVHKTNPIIASLNRAVQLMPAMIGAEGRRSYLLLFQNNAEVRATGGLPGAFAEIATHDGQIEIMRQASAGGMVYPEPVLHLPIETRGIYTDRVSTFMGDVTLTPQFAMTGALAREMWKRTYGTEVDGVISLDPVALSYLLRATGPITLATGEVLTSENAVQLLLSDVYANYDDPADQDLLFASAAAAVFVALAGGQADPKALISALAQAGDERRILLWSAHEEDQKLLEGTTLTGDLPVSDASAEKIGVYFNDATGAKMNTFLDTRIDLGEVTCRNDGRPYYAVDVTLTNTAPVDAATSLPESVTGPGTYGVVQGNIKTIILVYGPPNSQNLGVTRGGETVPYHPASDTGYPVSQLAVELAPGESSTTRFYLLGGDAEHGALEAVHTPVLNLLESQKIEVGCDSPLW